ncbi:hypothetical protein GRI34_11815 [Erythrobacter aquimaris]|uniref:Uncharacterized protein n=1 Tax=Qipengyuania aquimaris TaxID=255984 RepID=A0A6I4TRR3_9SPHN|nr:hypothetical protein [Qipengyuania aquimaris]MXO97103.1 hypothetical protein [Qipengyuania aquimaris]
METSVFTKQRKKLVMIGLFLLSVVLMVGREDDPGMLQQIAEQTNDQAQPPAAAQTSAPTQQRASAPRPQVRQDPALDDWYAQAGTLNAPMEPSPQDNSWLINDTEPLVSTEPVG